MGGIFTRARADLFRGAGSLLFFSLVWITSSREAAQATEPGWWNSAVDLNQSASSADWGRNVKIDPNGRANPYVLPPGEYEAAIRQGRLHALHYPIEVTGILLPYKPIERFLTADSQSPLKRLIQKTVSGVNRMRSYDELQDWLGLHAYPNTEGEGAYFVPFKDGRRPEHRMGFTLMQGPNGQGFTISCAQCHSANLFGRRVIGLTNRFPRANEFFARGLQIAPAVNGNVFRWSTDSNDGETQMFKSSRASLFFVGAKKPAQLGLDTSLAQVALSLAKREVDPWASRIKQERARPELLSRTVADSKPAVWWNLKYKNRWLSDGSVVAGNPIFTNIIWNELGRGTDLKLLEDWLAKNERVIRDLTTAVFSAEAPRWTDFFPAGSIDVAEAKRGQAIFANRCAKCHGTYEKAWDQAGANSLPWAEQLRTTRVAYPEQTKVVDVGTDPGRWQGMRSLMQLNDLDISKKNGIVIETQKGYVPPPLVGIWSRWPYFHNNSAPSLCAVLTPGPKRPGAYWARPANDPETDFDKDCNGYPLTAPPPKTPKMFLYDTRREGLGNRGHDERIFIENGQEILTGTDKRALIRFLQTL